MREQLSDEMRYAPKMPDQVKYRREGHKPPGSPGYHMHLSGDNSWVNINSVDKSANTINKQSVDFTTLSAELAKLRKGLLERALTPEHYIAIGAIASAEIETESGDVPKVKRALSVLGTAGRWVLDTSKEIGVSLVAELLKAGILEEHESKRICFARAVMPDSQPWHTHSRPVSEQMGSRSRTLAAL